jgi:hypothetical protein
MTIPTLLDAIVEALRSAGATEEIIAAAVGAAGQSVGYARWCTSWVIRVLDTPGGGGGLKN